MNVHVEFLPADRMRYGGTAGDYYETPAGIFFDILDQGDETDNLLVLAHELCEFICVKAKGIPIPQIDAFDQAFQGDGEPGDDPKAPYKHEHSIAVCVERLLCGYIGKDWTTYDQGVTANAKKS